MNYSITILYVDPFDSSNNKTVGFSQWTLTHCLEAAQNWADQYTIIQISIAADYSPRM